MDGPKVEQVSKKTWESLELLIGPITRGRSKRFKEALQGLVERLQDGNMSMKSSDDLCGGHYNVIQVKRELKDEKNASRNEKSTAGTSHAEANSPQPSIDLWLFLSVCLLLILYRLEVNNPTSYLNKKSGQQYWSFSFVELRVRINIFGFAFLVLQGSYHKVDNMCYMGNVKTTCCYICSNKSWCFTAFEGSQSVFSLEFYHHELQWRGSH